MSKFTKIAIATTMAITIVGTSLTAAQAGKRHKRNLALGIAGAIVGAAIVGNHNQRSDRRYRSNRRAHRNCWIEEREVWSRRHGEYIYRDVKVCR